MQQVNIAKLSALQTTVTGHQGQSQQVQEEDMRHHTQEPSIQKEPLKGNASDGECRKGCCPSFGHVLGVNLVAMPPDICSLDGPTVPSSRVNTLPSQGIAWPHHSTCKLIHPRAYAPC